MADETLAVVPAGLRAAARLIAGQAAALSAPGGGPGGAVERSGQAAAAVYRALDGYRAGLSHRLLVVSEGLMDAADRYARMDTSSGAALNSIVPLGRPWL